MFKDRKNNRPFPFFTYHPRNGWNPGYDLRCWIYIPLFFVYMRAFRVELIGKRRREQSEKANEVREEEEI